MIVDKIVELPVQGKEKHHILVQEKCCRHAAMALVIKLFIYNSARIKTKVAGNI